MTDDLQERITGIIQEARDNTIAAMAGLGVKATEAYADRILVLLDTEGTEPVAWAPMMMEYHEDGLDTEAGLLVDPATDRTEAFDLEDACRVAWPEYPAIPLFRAHPPLQSSVEEVMPDDRRAAHRVSDRPDVAPGESVDKEGSGGPNPSTGQKAPDTGSPESWGKAGHCHDIDGYLWHEVGECDAPECRKNPCCGWVAQSEPSEDDRIIARNALWLYVKHNKSPKHCDCRGCEDIRDLVIKSPPARLRTGADPR